MPKDLTITNEFMFFWSGWPSQWFRSPFTLGGTLYTCCEQYMMAEKARVFGDAEVLTKILAARNPREQKALGRQIRNFDEVTWTKVCRGIVYTANFAKFQQHPNLGRALLNTENRTIVEASPEDRIWGIGLAADHPDAQNPSRWPGKNWLGIALMQVRDSLLRPSSPLDPMVQQQLQARKALDHGEKELA